MDVNPGKTDEELMREYVAGDETALGILLSRYEKALYFFTYPYFRSPSQSEEIVQDIMVKLIENRHHYQPEKPFKPWIYRIARNRIYDELRRIRRWNLLHFHWSQPGESIDTAKSPREKLNQEQLQKIMLDVIQTLDSRARDLIILRHLQQLPVKEVAEILGIAEGTVHSGTNRALETLHKKLIQKGISQEDIT
jgi:RNA polymerase sigma-70 factor, ECF subfamily